MTVNDSSDFLPADGAETQEKFVSPELIYLDSAIRDTAVHTQLSVESITDNTLDEISQGERQTALLRQRRRKSDSRPTYDEDVVGAYFRQIGRYEILTKSQETELSKTVRDGNELRAVLEDGSQKPTVAEKRLLRQADRAKERFIHSNLRLVVSIAKRYPLPQGMTLMDVIQEGNLGLEHAVDKFDGRKGFKFSTYATFWIRQAIGRAVDSKGSLIRLPSDKAVQLRQALRTSNGEIMSLDRDIAELERMSNIVSLDKPLNDDYETTFGDMIEGEGLSPEAEVMVKAKSEYISDILNELDSRTALAIRQRFGIGNDKPMTFDQIGHKLGITGEAARRIILRGIKIIRESTSEPDLVG